MLPLKKVRYIYRSPKLMFAPEKGPGPNWKVHKLPTIIFAGGELFIFGEVYPSLTLGYFEKHPLRIRLYVLRIRDFPEPILLKRDGMFRPPILREIGRALDSCRSIMQGSLYTKKRLWLIGHQRHFINSSCISRNLPSTILVDEWNRLDFEDSVVL